LGNIKESQTNWVKFRRQFSIGRYILDFYSSEYKLGIEADGGQHYKHKVKHEDDLRTKELSKLGVEILRFSDLEILNNIEGVFDVIQQSIENRKSTPSPQTLSP